MRALIAGLAALGISTFGLSSGGSRGAVDAELTTDTLEVSVQPAGEEAEEWVKLKNVGFESVDISGWFICETVLCFEFPTETNLAPTDSLMVFSGRGISRAGRFYMGRSRGVWDDEGGAARLFDVERTLVTTQEYAGAQSAPKAVPAAPPARRCCTICSTGKACGNSCIARNRTCRQPPGCACNGEVVPLSEILVRDEETAAFFSEWRFVDGLFARGEIR